MNFNGISKIQISNEAIEAYFNRLTSGSVNNISEVSVKFDNRPNIVSTFAKVFVRGNSVDYRFYTSAITNQWEDVFNTSDGVGSATEALLFLFTYLTTKIFSSQKETSYEIRNNLFEVYHNDVNFIEVSEKFPSLFSVYTSLIPQTSSINISDVLDMTIKKPYPEIPEE